MAFARLEPFGERYQTLQTAMLLSFLANVLDDKRKWTPEDFMPDWEKTQSELQDEHEAQFRAKLFQTMELFAQKKD